MSLGLISLPATVSSGIGYHISLCSAIVVDSTLFTFLIFLSVLSSYVSKGSSSDSGFLCM